MGRYSRRLAPLLAAFAGVRPGLRALDVGCGPGSLTARLADVLGAQQVAAAEPSEPFAAACAERVPGADVRRAGAESLPWADGSFDAVLSQLAVNFLTDAHQGVREMRRVAREGGVVAACTGTIAGGWRCWPRSGTRRSSSTRRPERGPADAVRDPRRVPRPLEGGGPARRGDRRTGGRGGVRRLRRLLGAVHRRGRAGRLLLRLPRLRGPGGPARGGRRLGSPQGAFRLRARAWAVRGSA